MALSSQHAVLPDVTWVSCIAALHAAIAGEPSCVLLQLLQDARYSHSVCRETVYFKENYNLFVSDTRSAPRSANARAGRCPGLTQRVWCGEESSARCARSDSDTANAADSCSCLPSLQRSQAGVLRVHGLGAQSVRARALVRRGRVGGASALPNPGENEHLQAPVCALLQPHHAPSQVCRLLCCDHA
eukprot:912666-Rhodomonas_salina.2